MNACAASGRITRTPMRADRTTYCPRCGQRLYVGTALRVAGGGYRIPRHRSVRVPRAESPNRPN
jgi:hypothetical protein